MLKTKLFAVILQSCLAPQAKILDIWSANYTLERRSWPSQNLNVLFFHSLPQISAFRAKLRQTHFHEIDFFGASRQDFFFGIQVGSFGIQLRQPWLSDFFGLSSDIFSATLPKVIGELETVDIFCFFSIQSVSILLSVVNEWICDMMIRIYIPLVTVYLSFGNAGVEIRWIVTRFQVCGCRDVNSIPLFIVSSL